MTREEIWRMVEGGRQAGLAHLKVDAELPADLPMRALLVQQARRLETAREQTRDYGYSWPGDPRVRREAAWLEALCLRAMGFDRKAWGRLVHKAREAEADIREELAVLSQEIQA